MIRIKQFSIVLMCGGVIGCISNTPALADDKATPGVAVVELFTSEGCSSCPPADAAVGDLIRDSKGDHLYVLAYHVDYWDDLGWVDPFSHPIFTSRQNEYRRLLKLDNIYTPQAVINGQLEFIGSNRAKLCQGVATALQTPTAGTLAATVTHDPASAKVEVRATGLPAGTVVRVAIVRPTASTPVIRGENGGRTLTHDNVVRALASAPLDAGGLATVSLTSPREGWPADALVILFAQRPTDGRVLAATEVRFTQ